MECYVVLALHQAKMVLNHVCWSHVVYDVPCNDTTNKIISYRTQNDVAARSQEAWRDMP